MGSLAFKVMISADVKVWRSRLVRGMILALVWALAVPASVVLADATMRSGDTFELRIGGVPTDEVVAFNNTYTIDADGNLNLPLLGKLNVSGMTPGQIQTTIERAYKARDIYTHPTITLVSSQARFVSVGGAVKSPQRVAYTSDMTILSAINAAGDFNEFADQKRVRLLRGDKVSIVNCKDIRRDPSKDLKVLPGDQILVPEGFF